MVVLIEVDGIPEVLAKVQNGSRAARVHKQAAEDGR